ncbi:ankyrin repeat-containing protein [Elysia marginata]|uniref:Ankyrin repeat-containing protein n=1 Tax=Elysia marginata TaxID=1093978 RepID=A0AAV4EBM2_9GAST|nr:ankyrin repeat-containing protein [Elysia marginata]
MNKCKLSKAISSLNIKEIKLLLESGQCSLNGDGYERFSPLIECITSEVSRRRYGFDGKAARGFTHDEVDARKCEILEVLLRNGAKINAPFVSDHSNFVLRGETAVMLAARRGYLRCLRLLVESGADLTVVSRFKNTALIFSVEAEQVECVKYLAEHTPASMLNHRGQHGMTALMCATFFSGENRLLCMQHLIKSGVDVNATDADGKTALAIAVANGNTEAMTLLLQEKALVNSVSNDGLTVLSLALENATFSFATYKSVVGVVNKLFQYGADPTLSRRHRDFLHVAVMYVDNAMVKTLVKNAFPHWIVSGIET